MAKRKKLFDEHNFKIVLQQLAETEFSNKDIGEFDLESFSGDKKMFEYQVEALQNAMRVLLTYFNDFESDKQKFYNAYNKYPHANLDFKPNDMLAEHYQVIGNRIEFSNFINRMSFWMTMGSGKTVVIIKLIELLDKAMELNLIPRKNIMFFTANEGLLDAFQVEVDEYNINAEKQIETISLKDYENRQRYGTVFDSQLIKVFCYRADVMTEETKDTQLDYKDYLDNGNNYVFLDEAHKGEKQTSNRQNIFTLLSQNGFLFNFSATFTDESDIATTVYNLNQAVWVKKGYGKKLFLLENDLKAFKNKTDLNDNEKQKALIKSLLLLAFAKKHKLNITNGYHEPMMVVFVNSVNTDDADAKLFFRQIATLVNEKDNTIFKEAKKELVAEFNTTNYLVTDKNGDGVNELADELKLITFSEMKTLIFYKEFGNVEAIINPRNNQEIAFKIDSSDKPFGLLKIGDTSTWKSDELLHMKVDATYKDTTYFKSLDESSINILIGSRSFYEGWDTTRPNIMLFLNIGMDKEAKKFVTQSIGRGMRVESVNGSRQRLDYLDVENKAEDSRNAKALETLFVISTNKEAIETIVEWQEAQSRELDWAEVELKKREITHELYIPQYKSKTTSATKITASKSFKLSSQNKRELKLYFTSMSESAFCLRHRFSDKREYQQLKELIENESSFYVDNNIHYKSLDFLIEKLRTRLYVKTSKIDSFKPLSNEIQHFKKIKVVNDREEEFVQYVEEASIQKLLTEAEIIAKLTEGTISLNDIDKYKKPLELYDATFMNLSTHYYTPVVTEEDSKWLKNIISVPSEVIFIDKLNTVIEEINAKYDWWMFSKLNEHYDKGVYIPYIEDGVNKPFYPDFIFWLQKGNKQTILFLDPKGNMHTAPEHKIDGYKELFEEENKPILFRQGSSEIEVRLAMYKIKDKTVGKSYEPYWVAKDSLSSFFKYL